MGRVSRGRHIAAGQFVFALRAGFDRFQALANRVVDALIIAQLKMQAGVVFNRAPIAAEQRRFANHVKRACHIAARVLGHDEQNAVAQILAQ